MKKSIEENASHRRAELLAPRHLLCLIAAMLVSLTACDDGAPTSTDIDVAIDSDADASGEDVPVDGDDTGDLDADEGDDVENDPNAPDVAVDVPVDAVDEDAHADMTPDLLDEDVVLEFPPGPPEILLTIDELPAQMNGSLPYMDGALGPFDFTMLLPTWGFTLDLVADRPAGYLDHDSFEVRCDAAFGPEGELAADSDISAQFEWDRDRIRWLVPSDLAAPEATITCRGRVADLDGELADWSEVSFETMVQTDAMHPFRPADTWVVTFSRDRYDIRLEGIETGDYEVVGEQIEGGDGEPDFIEDLRLLGLLGDETGSGAADIEIGGVTGVNDIIVDRILTRTMREVRRHYGLDPETGRVADDDSVNMTIFYELDADAPNASAFDGTFSIHGVGGDSPPNNPGLFGRATAVDINNHSAQNDSVLGYGTFTTNLIRTVIEQPAGRLVLGKFLPGYGIPFGESDLDVEILAEDFNPREAITEARNRFNQLNLLTDFLVKGLAALIAHEMGHSLGLVSCGAPPYGLFSGIYDPSWMAGDPGCGHIDTEGLNIMQTGASLFQNPQDIMGEVAFCPLSMAYLRGRLIVLED